MLHRQASDSPLKLHGHLFQWLNVILHQQNSAMISFSVRFSNMNQVFDKQHYIKMEIRREIRSSRSFLFIVWIGKLAQKNIEIRRYQECSIGD